MLNVKMSVREITAEVAQHCATVYREIKRNCFVDTELPKLNGNYGMNAQWAAAREADWRAVPVKFRYYMYIVGKPNRAQNVTRRENLPKLQHCDRRKIQRC